MMANSRSTPGSRLARATAVALATLCIAIAAHAAQTQRTFATPEDAAGALAKAAESADRKAVLEILGSGAASTIFSGDRVADKAAGEEFVKRFGEKHAVVAKGERATLTIGNDDWPFAFPLVKVGDAWRFDTKAGAEELVARRIGENELSAINVLLAIVDAQVEYASQDRDKSGLRQYARKFASTDGRRDGLYWKTKAGEPPSPLGALVTQAAGEGYGSAKSSGPRPYHGYYYRILTAQGPAAKGGALDYVVKGRMIGGFAVVAWPARYGNSGVMTFIVNHDGVVYEKDLGPDTATLAREIKRFDPGPGWTATKPL